MYLLPLLGLSARYEAKAQSLIVLGVSYAITTGFTQSSYHAIDG